MHSRTSSFRLAALGIAAALGAGLLAGCSSDSEGTSTGDEKTTISVGVFGVFGYKQAGLYDEYEKLNPNVKIKENSTERNEDYYPALLNHLASGAGLADIQAIEVGNISELATVQSDKFVNLAEAPGVNKEKWLPWKWEQAKAEDGSVIGIGTDIGPMAVCYRKDLFEKAGLPTEPDQVGKMWQGDWSKYVEAGAEYTKNAPKGTSFMDSASGLYNAAVSSYAEKYYDKSGEVIYKDSQSVKASWDLAMEAIDGGMTGKLKQFDTSWDQAYANGDFASVVCPPWMLGYIKEKAADSGEDKWSVTAAPKPGNWGGSFLGVPKASKNQEEAIKLAAWLTAPQQQAKLFQAQGSFPSSVTAFNLPEVKEAKHEYFGDAPIGTIFSEAAKGIPTAIIGPKDATIRQHISDTGILQVEQQGKSPEAGWKAAVKAIDNAIDA